jgi:hypothetical protein
VVEQVPVYDEPGYRTALRQWRGAIWRAQLDIIADGLTFTLSDAVQAELAAVRAIGMRCDGTDRDYLRFCVGKADQIALVEAVYYASTVTPQGIAEAAQRLDYTWRGKPVTAWAVGYTHGKRGDLGVDMRAALRSHLTWAQFCALPGPEQSTLVAFWLLEERLSWLAENNAN